MRKLVSVIIPIYNTEKYLKRCVNSILNQTYRDLEIILVNDGSTDHSLKICEEFKQLDERIRILSEKNRGVSYARNNGIKNARGEYLYFADSDDYLDADAIRKLVQGFQSCELVVAGYKEVDLRNQVVKINRWGNLKLKSDEAARSVLDEEGMGGYLWNKLFDSSIIQKRNIRFDEKINVWEDVLFVMEYLKWCTQIAVIDEDVYAYCRREGSAVEYARYTPALHTQLTAIKKIEKLGWTDDSIKEALQYRKARCCLGLVRSMITGKNFRKDQMEKVRAELKRIPRKTIFSLSRTDKISWMLIRIHPGLFGCVYSVIHPRGCE